MFFKFIFCSGFFAYTHAFMYSGSTPPLGFWDPLDLSKDLEIGHLAFVRESELKHGRLAMVSLFVMPLIEKQTHHPSLELFTTLDANKKALIVFSLGLLELHTMLRGWENPFLNTTNLFKLKSDYEPGDYGIGIIQQMGYIEREDANNVELNHGRLAMIISIILIAIEQFNNVPLFATKGIDLVV